MNKLMRLWNNFDMARVEDWGTKPLFIPFGRWQWNRTISQQFLREGAVKMSEELAAMIDKGEPGIPVYQGHPDVPQLATRYPDKGAIGWIKRIDVKDKGVELTVEWDRFPGKGFGWMSPYWAGEWNAEHNLITVDRMISLGLVNNPNIRSFRLPNEELTGCTTQEGENSMNIEAIKKELGLPETATEAEVEAAIKKAKADGEGKAAAEAKAAATENACNDAKKKCENAEKELADTKAKLANAEKELGETKTALANEKAEVEKLKKLKTASATEGLENQREESQGDCLALVNEIMAKDHVDYDTAWDRAAKQKPELFK